MPAVANPSHWVSVAKELPTLLARQLKDNETPWHNKPSITTLSLFSGNVWYKHELFWIFVAIGVALLACGGGALLAASGSDRRQAEPPTLMASLEAQEAKRAEEAEEHRRWLERAAESDDTYMSRCKEWERGQRAENTKMQRERRAKGLIQDRGV